jgi:hypothetical protein
MSNKSNYVFELDEEQIQKFEIWKAQQKEKDDSMPTAGERWTFMFTPSGLGIMYSVKDQKTGDILDLTDWENF